MHEKNLALCAVDRDSLASLQSREVRNDVDTDVALKECCRLVHIYVKVA